MSRLNACKLHLCAHFEAYLLICVQDANSLYEHKSSELGQAKIARYRSYCYHLKCESSQASILSMI